MALTVTKTGTFKHLRPSQVLGFEALPASAVPGTFILHDVLRGLYAQTGSPPSLVGAVPAASDGQGGIAQLARSFDARMRTPQGEVLSVSYSGSTLTITWPNMAALWDGTMQQLNAGSQTFSVGDGSYSFTVAYNWGLTQTQLISTASYDPAGPYVEMARVQITGGVASLVNSLPNFKLITGLAVNGNQNSTDIPVSDASGNMPF